MSWDSSNIRKVTEDGQVTSVRLTDLLPATSYTVSFTLSNKVLSVTLILTHCSSAHFTSPRERIIYRPRSFLIKFYFFLFFTNKEITNNKSSALNDKNCFII